MKKPVWLLQSGKCTIGENELSFEPFYKDNKLESEGEVLNSDKQSVSKKKPDKTLHATSLYSNLYFTEGIISFNYKSVAKGNTLIFIFNSNSNFSLVRLFFNYSDSMVLIKGRDKKNSADKFIASFGDGVHFENEKTYAIVIKTLGSLFQVLVDGILVISTAINITKTQIKLAHAGSAVIVSNFKVDSARPKAFVIMQFGNGYDPIYNDLIKPTVEDAGFECVRGDEQATVNLILQDIIVSIKEASLIIADITPDNPNVYYELGYAHAINKPTIILCDSTRSKLPFDVSGFRTLFYDNSIHGKGKIEKTLKIFIENILASNDLQNYSFKDGLNAFNELE